MATSFPVAISLAVYTTPEALREGGGIILAGIYIYIYIYICKI